MLRVVFPLIKWDPLKADYFRLKTLYDTYLNSQQKLPIQGSKLSILVVQLFHSVLFPPEVLDIFYRCFQNGSLVLAGITAGKGITKVQQRASPSTSSVPIYSTTSTPNQEEFSASHTYTYRRVGRGVCVQRV